MNARIRSGFTLLELLVAMLVAGVILVLGIPNLLEFSRNSAMTTLANDFQTAVMLARERAVTTGQPVTLCASPNPVSAASGCSADGSETNGGFIAWVDADADAVVDSGEEVLLQRGNPADIAVFADNGYIHFLPNGNLDDIAGLGASASMLLMCDARGNSVAAGSLSAARAFRVYPTGRSDMFREVAEIAPIVTALGAACP